VIEAFGKIDREYAETLEGRLIGSAKHGRLASRLAQCRQVSTP
jgi:hypothetical protein